MAEPWLDSLSEDWNSQPRSSPGSLPSFGTPSASTRSRIPRFSHSSYKGSSVRQPKRKASQSASKTILSERSVSDINISAHSSSAASPSKPAERERAYTISSASSTGSIVKESSVLRKSRSSSPEKTKGSAGTPEWKKLVVKGKMAQPDLFATKPLELQGIFQKPPDTPVEESSPVRSSFTFFQGLDSVPSSPPPWPKDHRGAQMTFKRTQASMSEQFLDTVPEQIEDEEHGDRLPEVDDEQQHPTESQHRESGPVPTSEGRQQNEQKQHMRWIPQTDGSSELLSSSERGLGSDDLPAAATSPHQQSTNLRNDPTSKDRVTSRATVSSSSTTAGFSPVFISKHNTVDGRVGYAAVDVSDPETLELMRSHTTNEQTPNDDREDDMTDSPDQSIYATPAPGPLRFSSSQSEESTQLPQISPYVDTRRGGYSEESSFMRRPLSSSVSSSVVPSDSISQTGISRRSIATSYAWLPHVRMGDHDNSDSPISVVDDHDSLSSTTAVNDRDPSFSDREGSGHGLATGDIIPAEAQSIVQDTAASDDGSGTAPSVETTFRRSDSRIQQLATVTASSRPTTPASQLLAPNVQDQLHKRQNSASTKGPTPKRIRTLTTFDLPVENREHVSDTVQEQHRRMQAVIGKRKDARYDNSETSCDPEVLSRRAILRPRHPTPGQQQQPQSSSDEDIEASIRLDLEDVQGHIDSFPLPASTQEDHDEIRSLASKVATIRITEARHASEPLRQPSFSTQDFIYEATMVMDYIRSRPPGHSQLPDIEESEAEEMMPDDSLQQDDSVHTISRPPSREGGITPWRSRDGRPLDPRVVSHLKQYQETGDETFLMSSVMESMHSEKVEEDEPYEREAEEDDPDHISIRIIEARDESPVGSPVKTHASQDSTDSARTVQTTLSQRSRNLPNIPPDKVHHLLQTESSGMRFDERKNTWVKTKKPRRSADVSSSTGTEDDPFMNIPDLRSNEHSEMQNHRSAPEFPGPSAEPSTASGNKPAIRPRSANGVTKATLEEEQVEAGSTPLATQARDSQPSEEDRSYLTESDRVVDEQLDSHTSQAHSQRHPQQGAEEVPTEFPQSKKTQMPAVAFSSSPRARRDMDLDPEESHGDSGLIATTNRDNVKNRTRGAVDTSLVVSKRSKPQTPLRHDPPSENKEICFTRTRPDGRTMSLTLSMSTPLPATKSRQMIPSSGLRSNLWHTMSPLSEFSIHQDDRTHLRSRHFDTRPDQQVVAHGSHVQAPAVVSTLVTEITNAQPDEPYWEYVEELDLTAKELDNLHMLDEFCPRLENLDAAQNKLKHLEGAPATIRQMNVMRNQLSSLTTWTHLANLQYLDISGNGIEDLEALRGLVHLRELKADDNRVRDIEGLFDLDGLLSVSLRGNDLRHVDFSSARMNRLSKVDLDDNALQSVQGLHCLPALDQINLGNNLISGFPYESESKRQCAQLRRLELPNNTLTSIDVSGSQQLQYLNVDSNKLTCINGIEAISNLQTLSIRSQTPDPKSPSTLAASLPSFSEIHHLYLSANDLSTLPSTLTSSTPFLNTRTLELALCSISTLPKDFAQIFPNLRTLNLNFNALRDLRPLRGIKKLKSIHLAGNRISRLRRIIAVLSTLGQTLEEIDLRENPLVQGFYPPASFGTSVLDVVPSQLATGDSAAVQQQEQGGMKLQHLLPPTTISSADAATYLSRLDEDTRLRRRVYEILLAALCPALKVVDGRSWEQERERVLKRDGDWERLVGCGVLECVGGEM